MLKRSSIEASVDESERALNVVRQATDEDASGPELFAYLIPEIHDALHEGKSPEDIAKAVWPRVKAIVAETTNPAAELGRKGGKKGGKARAKSLTPEERSEIARKAANARWRKEGESEEW